MLINKPPIVVLFLFTFIVLLGLLIFTGVSSVNQSMYDIADRFQPLVPLPFDNSSLSPAVINSSTGFPAFFPSSLFLYLDIGYETLGIVGHSLVQIWNSNDTSTIQYFTQEIRERSSRSYTSIDSSYERIFGASEISSFLPVAMLNNPRQLFTNKTEAANYFFFRTGFGYDLQSLLSRLNDRLNTYGTANGRTFFKTDQIGREAIVEALFTKWICVNMINSAFPSLFSENKNISEKGGIISIVALAASVLFMIAGSGLMDSFPKIFICGLATCSILLLAGQIILIDTWVTARNEILEGGACDMNSAPNAKTLSELGMTFSPPLSIFSACANFIPQILFWVWIVIVAREHEICGCGENVNNDNAPTNTVVVVGATETETFPSLHQHRRRSRHHHGSRAVSAEEMRGNHDNNNNNNNNEEDDEKNPPAVVSQFSEVKPRTSKLECPVCLERFNVSNRKPLFLNCCGKSLCAACWMSIRRNSSTTEVRCPQCRSTNLPCNLVPNRGLMDCIEEEDRNL
jgi:hypothetical protein